MTECFVAKVGEMPDGDRRIVAVSGKEIGVFRHGGNYYAYSNYCLHQGGPACEGVLIARVEEIIGPDHTYQGQRFSREHMHFVCPWHGYEYDMKTGECVADPRLRLRKYEVVVRDEYIYVRV
jgi:nitrite reductase/ring-hydroxylating ferredoxin subunit